mmetsp:Transcript_11959/g.20880  ORF Transcript_11959/g.20880 Transcript_11959/m.20880 type:complete len:644 (+) Transcript_11959:67-1998(+)
MTLSTSTSHPIFVIMRRIPLVLFCVAHVSLGRRVRPSPVKFNLQGASFEANQKPLQVVDLPSDPQSFAQGGQTNRGTRSRESSDYFGLNSFNLLTMLMLALERGGAFNPAGAGTRFSLRRATRQDRFSHAKPSRAVLMGMQNGSAPVIAPRVADMGVQNFSVPVFTMGIPDAPPVPGDPWGPVPGNPLGTDRESVQSSPLGDEWRVGTLTCGQKYLWRETDDPDDPDIKFVDYTSDRVKDNASDNTQTNVLSGLLADGWKLDALSDGQNYVWRKSDAIEDGLEILLVGSHDDEHLAAENDWRLDFLPCGKAYLWRLTDDPILPEIRMWKMPNLDADELATANKNEVELKKDVLEFRRQHLGQEHVHTLKAMNDYADLLEKAGRQVEVHPLMKEAFELTRRVLGPEHPESIRALRNYASQETRQKQVFEHSRLVLGQEHPDTLKALENYALTIALLGRDQEAETLSKEVLEATRRVHGADHPHMLKALRNYAITLDKLDRIAEAEPVKKELLERTRHFHSPEHSETLRALNSYAATLSKLGRHAEAEPLTEEVLELTRKEFGEEHPVTLVALRNYAVEVGKLGRETEAQFLRKRIEELTQIWRRFTGFGVISKDLGPFCKLEADEFFNQIEEECDVMEFLNPYS